MLKTIQTLVQSYIDMDSTGTVNIWVCEGIPGNCTLWPLDSRLLWIKRGLLGFTTSCTEHRFTLLYLDTTPNGGWIDGLGDWCRQQRAQDPSFLQVKVEKTGCKQNADGTFSVTACITAEKESVYEGEVGPW